MRVIWDRGDIYNGMQYKFGGNVYTVVEDDPWSPYDWVVLNESSNPYLKATTRELLFILNEGKNYWPVR